MMSCERASGENAHSTNSVPPTGFRQSTSGHWLSPLPAKGVAPVTTSLSVAASDAIVVGSVLARGSRDYQLDVKLHFSTSVGQIDVDVAHTGQLGSPSVALQ
jgi:hypothetical protein